MSGSIPASALYFGSYEWFKLKSNEHGFGKTHPNLAHLLGGIFAEAVACIFFVPIDVIKERRQVQSSLKAYDYKSDADAVRQVAKHEGIRGLYRAYWATVGSFGPFSALYFMFYEKSKQMCLGESNETLGFMQSMLCSWVSGGLASTLTNPLDLAKLRLQVQRAGGSKVK